MLKRILYVGVAMVMFSCGSSDTRSQLSELKKERDNLDSKIKKLELQLKKSNGKSVEQSITVNVAKLIPQEFNHYIKVQGVIESDNNIFIPVQTPGIVTKIYVEEGDKVRKGQVLAQIDADLIKRSIEEIKVSLKLAKTVYERQSRLWEKKIGSEVQYLNSKTQKESLELKLAGLKKRLEMSKIIAPIGGTVDDIRLKEGEMAGAGASGIRVVSVSDLKIKSELSEQYINDISKADKVNVYIPSLNSKTEESVESVGKVIDPANRTFQLEIKAPKVDGIKPNMNAVLGVNDYTNPEALMVSLDIIQRTGDAFFLFTAKEKNGKWYASKTNVKVGKYYNNMIEVLDGLSEGDFIISFGYQHVSDGSLLSIRK
ncbi:MAG: efflux RND transporter periplasmic adaptor subunit [Marinifilaceae bacterium]|jgi:RND family efflux transporter MFP subunit|nr:efflux RND transporter periplasmic adaptor subunit [Marinifilaceae bacterium]